MAWQDSRVVMRPNASEYTMADNAPSDSETAVFRGTLLAVRHALGSLDVDLISDSPWPGDVLPAVDRLRLVTKHGRLRRRESITARVDPTIDDQFEDALAVIPFTIGSTGLTHDAHLAYSADDTGTSLYVQLTPAERDVAREYIRDHGWDPALLEEHRRVRGRR